jgi:hypothetical protein
MIVMRGVFNWLRKQAVHRACSSGRLPCDDDPVLRMFVFTSPIQLVQPTSLPLHL